jgi:hypothetical protein
MYLNGTLQYRVNANGKTMRWGEGDGTMIMGGYPTALLSLSIKDRFVGWMDDLAYYSRVWSDAEVAAKWKQQADLADQSLFIYYNFDEGPGATVIKNWGSVGAQADLTNGKWHGADAYLESDSQVHRTMTSASYSPGAPMIVSATQPPQPIVYGVDLGTTVRLRVTCLQTASTMPLVPSAATLTSYTGHGTLYQTDAAHTPLTFPTPLTTPDFLFTTGPTVPAAVETLTYSCVCSGATQTGSISIIVRPVLNPRSTSLDLVQTSTQTLYLQDSIADNPTATLRINITSLPTLGYLSQVDYLNPSLVIPINLSHPLVTNPLGAVKYVPEKVGTDSFQFIFTNGGRTSTTATMSMLVRSWDFPPAVPILAQRQSIFNRKETVFKFPVKDLYQKQFIGVYIMTIPKKGKLYQINPDGSKGAPITKPYARVTRDEPIIQYAMKVNNVSSFWGGSSDWSPLQVLGPQDCFEPFDCTRAWCPLTMHGTGGMVAGTGQGLSFSSNPDHNYNQFGWTEFIELEYNEPVSVTALLIGENRGMGAMKNILAKDPMGKWMTLWTTPTVDATLEILHYKYSQYRTFVPDVCQTPFLTKHMRFEMNTRDVPDWHEYDYFQLQGSPSADSSLVTYNGVEDWGIIYVPDPGTSGVDR